MLLPRYRALALIALLTSGCAQQPASTTTAAEPRQPLTGQWQVESVNGGGIIDASHLTLVFIDAERIAGSSGCNRYNAGFSQHDKDIRISAPASTRRACAPALMQQEQRFLQALSESVSYQWQDNHWVIFSDDKGEPRLTLIQQNPAP